jgi:hypothetical protein
MYQQASADMIDPYKNLQIHQMEAADELIEPEKEMLMAEYNLSEEEARAALSLLPDKTKLTRHQINAALKKLPNKTGAEIEAYKTAAYKSRESRPLLKKAYDMAKRGVNESAKMNAAETTVNRQFGQIAGQTARQLGRRGVRPGGNAYKAALGDVAIEQAKASAGARTKAARDAEDLEFARLSSAINL